MKTLVTPEATIGPFYPGAFLAEFRNDLWSIAPLLAHRPRGEPIVFVARFLDSSGLPVPSLVVEFWQANAFGRYRHPDDRSDAPLDPHVIVLFGVFALTFWPAGIYWFRRIAASRRHRGPANAHPSH